jgi:hypothetical protein
MRGQPGWFSLCIRSREGGGGVGGGVREEDGARVLVPGTSPWVMCNSACTTSGCSYRGGCCRLLALFEHASL